jgi:fructosamine-3-kinase
VISRVEALVGGRVERAVPRGSSITGSTWRLTLADGAELFVKHLDGAPDGFVAAEVLGLRWLAEAGGPPLPTVLASDDTTLVLPWIEPGEPTDAGADQFGQRLAVLHVAGASGFGAPWPGWIGAAELDNRGGNDWPEFYAERRVRPYVRRLRDYGAITAGQAASFDRLLARLPGLAGLAEPPARIHGDLWSGNLLWCADGQAWLLDPAAHGGHRETDLAMLQLFGAPRLRRILSAYQEHTPLATGWPERVPLHQLHPLLVHAVLFGGSYVNDALAIARRYVPSP